jgi:diguanylate cyclase (GGDEF)-like protein/PAS domain S-box-containing protein
MVTVRTLLRGMGLAGDHGKGLLMLDASALATFPAPIFVFDRDGQITAANTAAKELCLAVREGQVPGMAAAVARAVEAGGSQIETVVVPATVGPLLYQLNVMALAGGAAIVVAKDITLESNLRSALVESRQRYKDLVEISSNFAWEIGADGRFAFVSPRGALGYTADQLVGRKPEEFAVEHPGVDGLLPFNSRQSVEHAEAWFRRSDGQVACLLTSSAPLLDAEGNRRGARGVCHDVTVERAREAALASANNRERLLAHLVRTVRDAVDPTEMPAVAAEAAMHALGAAGCQILRRLESGLVSAALRGAPCRIEPVIAALQGADTFGGEVDDCQVLAVVTRYRRDANGAVAVWREAAGTPWGDSERSLLGDVANEIGVANEQIASHERILTLSRTDGLTGLFNRRAFFEEMARRLARLQRDARPAALIYMDLDNFKRVNDVYGHKRGDEALLAVRDILLQHTRPIDLVARLGGDEFALWLEGAEERIAVRRCDEMIDAALLLTQYSGNGRFPLTMSLGIAVYDPARPETLNDILARADVAMYAVKGDGKSDYRIAPPAGRCEETAK